MDLTTVSSVKNLSVTFDPLNESNTFGNGDYISGRVTLEVAKKTRIESLLVKAKGKASVMWTEHYGKNSIVVYHDKETCFKTIQYFIEEQKAKDYISGRVTLEVKKKTRIESLLIKAKGKASVLWTENHGEDNIVVYHDKETCFKTIQYFILGQKKQGQDGYSLLTNESGQCYPRTVDPGVHVYPFTFQIPHQNMPASFKGHHGKVVYFLEAKLCRSLVMAKKAKTYFNYVPRGALMSIPDLMTPQYGNKEKKMMFPTSGRVAMDVRIEKLGFHLGEQMKVKIDVVNNSSRSVKPKFSLYQKQSFFASKKKMVRTKELLKEKSDPIDPSTEQSVTKVLNIPADTCLSILNCKVLKVEYRLMVYLDIKFARDPEIKLPVVIHPVSVPEEEKDLAKPDMGIGFESWTSKQADLFNSDL